MQEATQVPNIEMLISMLTDAENENFTLVHQMNELNSEVAPGWSVTC